MSRLMAVVCMSLLVMVSLTVSAQDGSPPTEPDSITFDIVRDATSFTIIFPEMTDGGATTADVSRLGFGSGTGDDYEVNALTDYSNFNMLASSLPLPICLRIIAPNHQAPIPQACQNVTIIDQQINASDIFWYDTFSINVSTITVVDVTDPDGAIAFCGGGQAVCTITYPLPMPEQPEPTVEVVVTDEPTPVPQPTATAIPATDADLGITEDMTPEEIIWRTINAARIRAGMNPLARNGTLDMTAQTQGFTLIGRGPNPGNTYLDEQDQAVDTLIANQGYPAYQQSRDDYDPDMMVILTGANQPITEDTLIDIIQETPERFTSYRIQQGDAQTTDPLPFLNPIYREVGIFVGVNSVTEARYYVLIFASQPDVLPVLVASPSAPLNLTDTITGSSVLLYISDEGASNGGTSIGPVSRMRVSEISRSTDGGCTDDSWTEYQASTIYDQLSFGLGNKTIYVQLCDAFGTILTNEVVVTVTE